MKAPPAVARAEAPPLLLVAHGTRQPDGPRVLEVLRRAVGDRLPAVALHLAYVDVIGPRLEQVLAVAPGAVVVPLFLSAGYHVRVDLPAAVAATGRTATVTTPIGPSDEVVGAVAERLAAAGPAPDAIVLAAAGSSDPRARSELVSVAARLERLTRLPVRLAYVASAMATVDAEVGALRAAGHRRIGVASYLLAPGLFQRRLLAADAELVGAPIGAHPAVVGLVVDRYREAAARRPVGPRVSA